MGISRRPLSRRGVPPVQGSHWSRTRGSVNWRAPQAALNHLLLAGSPGELNHLLLAGSPGVSQAALNHLLFAGSPGELNHLLQRWARKVGEVGGARGLL